MISENTFLKDLPAQPIQAILTVCDRVLEFDAPKNNKERIEHYDDYLNVISALANYAAAHRLNLDFPELTTNVLSNINRITEFFEALRNSIKSNIEQLSEGNRTPKEDTASLENFFIQDITRKDKQRAQHLLNRLRTLLVESEAFEERHRARCLSRLERLQQALHQEITSGSRLSDFF
jgi:hypothetical protein